MSASPNPEGPEPTDIDYDDIDLPSMFSTRLTEVNGMFGELQYEFETVSSKMVSIKRRLTHLEQLGTRILAKPKTPPPPPPQIKLPTSDQETQTEAQLDDRIDESEESVPNSPTIGQLVSSLMIHPDDRVNQTDLTHDESELVLNANQHSEFFHREDDIEQDDEDEDEADNNEIQNESPLVLDANRNSEYFHRQVDQSEPDETANAGEPDVQGSDERDVSMQQDVDELVVDSEKDKEEVVEQSDVENDENTAEKILENMMAEDESSNTSESNINSIEATTTLIGETAQLEVNNSKNQAQNESKSQHEPTIDELMAEPVIESETVAESNDPKDQVQNESQQVGSHPESSNNIDEPMAVINSEPTEPEIQLETVAESNDQPQNESPEPSSNMNTDEPMATSVTEPAAGTRKKPTKKNEKKIETKSGRKMKKILPLIQVFHEDDDSTNADVDVDEDELIARKLGLKKRESSSSESSDLDEKDLKGSKKDEEEDESNLSIEEKILKKFSAQIKPCRVLVSRITPLNIQGAMVKNKSKRNDDADSLEDRQIRNLMNLKSILNQLQNKPKAANKSKSRYFRNILDKH